MTYTIDRMKDIDMLDLLMTAYAGGRAEKVLPFVIPCVSSENECHAADGDAAACMPVLWLYTKSEVLVVEAFPT